MAYSTVDGTAGGYAFRLLVPDNYTNRHVMYHHGSGEAVGSLLGDALKANVVARLLSDGYLLSESTAANNNWGNQAALDAYEAVLAYVNANYSPTKWAIFSQSMGGLTGLQMASARPVNLVAWFGIYPVCNLANMFGNNAGTYASAIRSAYGIEANGSDYSSLTSGHDPALYSGTLYARLPMRFWASYSDTVVGRTANSDSMQTLVAGSLAESTIVTCTGDHGHTSHFDPQGVSDFLERAFTARTTGQRRL